MFNLACGQDLTELGCLGLCYARHLGIDERLRSLSLCQISLAKDEDGWLLDKDLVHILQRAPRSFGI